MAQIAKIESQVDIKSSSEKFYKAFQKQYDFPKMCPNMVKEVHLIKGDWEAVGSIRKWIVAPAGDSPSSDFCVVRIEAADNENKSVTCNVVDGEIKKLYNYYAYTIQAIDKGDGSGSVVKTTIEYEKKNGAVPEPSKYLDYAAFIYKTIDAYLIGNA